MKITTKSALTFKIIEYNTNKNIEKIIKYNTNKNIDNKIQLVVKYYNK